MKILHINKTDSWGGAAIAGYNLHRALLKDGINSKMLVEHSSVTTPDVVQYSTARYSKQYNLWRFLRERVSFLPYEKSKKLRFSFSPDFVGTDISNHPLVKESDVVHLHWINQGFLSIKSIKKLISLNKPIVWTLHDMWPITGGCHYSWDCTKMESYCGNCQFLRQEDPYDLSYQKMVEKVNTLTGGNITMVALSQWLYDILSVSNVGSQLNKELIPNAIDTFLFNQFDKNTVLEIFNLEKEFNYILFGAARIDDDIKGLNYLIEALKLIDCNNMKIGVILFGGPPKFNKKIIEKFPCRVRYLNRLTRNETSLLYSVASLTCVPSEYETFGMVAAESMACGTPVVAFNNSGVCDIVDHKENGYLAVKGSVIDLSSGINWVLNHRNSNIRDNARKKICDNFSPNLVARKYSQLYSRLLNSSDWKQSDREIVHSPFLHL